MNDPTPIGRFEIARRVLSSWGIYNKRGGEQLGVVAWYAPWKTFVFQPFAGAEFSPDCLQDLARFMFNLKTEWLAEGGPA